MDEIKEQLKWLGVGSVDVEFYFDFIMPFYCLIMLFFSVDVPAIFCRQLSTAIPSPTCGQMRVGWSGTCKQSYFLHQISSFFCQNEVYNTNHIR